LPSTAQPIASSTPVAQRKYGKDAQGLIDQVTKHFQVADPLVQKID